MIARIGLRSSGPDPPNGMKRRKTFRYGSVHLLDEADHRAQVRL